MIDDAHTLEIALVEARPDLDVIDRALILDDLEVELVALDGAGRLVLVLLDDGEPGRTALRVLDGLRLDRRRLEVLADHLRPVGTTRLDATRPPRVVVLARHPHPALRERLAQLDPERVELLEWCEVKSARDTTAHWVAAGDEEAGAATFERLVEDLAPEERELVVALGARLARIDGEVVCRVVGGRARWRCRGEELAVVEPGRGGLEVLVHGHDAIALVGPSDVELAVGSAIGRYLTLAESRSGDAPEFEQVELIPRGSGAILTREEIDAFRD